MGASLCCSQALTGTSNLHEFQYTEELRTSEEWEDSDHDNEDFTEGRVRRCRTMPEELRQILDDAQKMRRTKSAHELGSLLKIQGNERWHRSSVVNRKGELQAKRYCRIINDDTLKHLRHSIRTASSIADKGTAINDELARQERVLSKAGNDIAIAEYETDQTTEKLKGMKSLGGKLVSVVWKKEPKLKKFSRKTSSFSNVNLGLLEEDGGLCAVSKMTSSKAVSISKDISKDKEDIQGQIIEGIGQLHKTLDAITIQQKDTALTLDQQDGHLTMFENRMTSTHRKINCQTQMINSIMGKS